METKQIFGCFSLRTSTLTLAFSFFNLAWSILLVNGSDNEADYTVGFVLAIITVLSLSLIWGLAIYGMIYTTYKTILISTVLWTIFIFFWLLMVLISFVDNTSALLVNHRGPESFWLMYNKYNRDEESINYMYYDHEEYEKKFGMCLSSAEHPMKLFSSNTDDSSDKELKDKIEELVYMKWTLIATSFSVFSYIVFGSWYVLYNLYKELYYKEKCECPTICNSDDEP